MTLMGDLPQ